MSKFLASVVFAVLYSNFASSVPVGDGYLATSVVELSSSSMTSSSTAAATAASASPTVPYASDDPNYWLWNDTTTEDPQPIRGSRGASILGPQNIPLDKQNPDLLAPPTTDSGSV